MAAIFCAELEKIISGACLLLMILGSAPSAAAATINRDPAVAKEMNVRIAAGGDSSVALGGDSSAGIDAGSGSVSSSRTGSDNAADVNRPIKDKWAVVIGISKFSDPAIPPLQYPAKDAQDFYNFLITRGNFARDHVLLLKDDQATRIAIVDAFGDGWLPRRAMRDDLVVIFVSTHGSPADVAGENFIIAHDSDPAHPYATGIRLQDLSGEVTKRTGCDRLVLLLDACHSGAAVTGGKSLLRAHSNFNLETIAGTGQLVISSSQPDQVSWESKRYPNGVFTHNLIESLDQYGKTPMVAEAFKHLKDAVEQEVRFDRVASQTPMLLSKWKGEEPALCAPPSEPRQVLPELPEQSRTYQPTLAVAGAPRPATIASAPRATTIASAPMPGMPPSPSVPAPTPAATAPSPTATAPTPAGPAPTASGSTSAAFTTPAVPAGCMMTTSWTGNGGDVTLESGTRLLKPEELRNLTAKQLLYLYNEAYARHGRGFISADIQRHFSEQPWYRQDPDYHFRSDDPRVIARNGQPDDSLVINPKRTPKQWSNMQLIKSMMKTAK